MEVGKESGKGTRMGMGMEVGEGDGEEELGMDVREGSGESGGKWLMKEGDSAVPGDALAEIETDHEKIGKIKML